MTKFVFRPKGERMYRGRYRLDPSDPLTHVPLHRTDKESARKVLDRIVLEAQQEREGIIPPKEERKASATPLVDHLQSFLRSLEVLGRVPKYVQNLEFRLSKLFSECGWSLPKQIQRGKFEDWRAGKREFSAKTHNEYLGAATAFLNWMVKTERMRANPLTHVQKVDGKGKVTKERRAFTADELKRLVSVSGSRGIVYLTAACTGLRRGELRQLRWNDVDLSEDSPRLRVRASTTKNGREAHQPLPRALVAMLDELKPSGAEPFDLVFAGLIPRMPRYRKDLEAAGIPYVDKGDKTADFHSLRNTCATALTLVGTSQREIMELMRHSDMRLTAKVYTDAAQLPLAGAVDNLPFFEPVHISVPLSVPECPKPSESVQSGGDVGSLGTLDFAGFGKLFPSLSDFVKWCAVQGSNLRPLPCEGNALPLS
jgi:integrase